MSARSTPDLVLLDAAGGILIEKAQSRPKNRVTAAFDRIYWLCGRDIEPGQIDFFDHRTTVTTNALLKMNGARLGILITNGFRAIQEVQSQARETSRFELKFN